MGVLQLSAEARERGFGKQRGDDERDHLPALFIIVGLYYAYTFYI